MASIAIVEIVIILPGRKEQNQSYEKLKGWWVDLFLTDKKSINIEIVILVEDGMKVLHLVIEHIQNIVKYVCHHPPRIQTISESVQQCKLATAARV